MFMGVDKMKTFVMEDVLTAYTSGLVVVKAKNKEKALKIILKEFSVDDFIYACVGDEKCSGEHNNLDCIRCKLRELKDNELVYVYGGG